MVTDEGLVAALSDTGRRMVLSNAERVRVLDELNSILARTSTVAEHVEVAAARAGTNVSVWTESHLDAILDAARQLRTAVERTPLEAD